MQHEDVKYFYNLQKAGLLNEYSREHFLIKVMNGTLDFFEKYPYLASKSLNHQERLNLANTFLMNFSVRLINLSRKFGEIKIEEFVRTQLAAGKKNYSEEQFFQAVSEVNVLSYLANFTGKFISGDYEPPNSNKKNPEARIKLSGNITLDVEVKTPEFENPYDYPTSKLGMIKPNVVLDNSGMKKIKKYCDDASFQLHMPRVQKLKDFIHSAADKFETPSHSRHFNLLFINWTYTDFPECGLSEPITLLTNPISGILYNDVAASLVKGLDRKKIDKISAIVLYRDTIDSILSSDFRYHFGHNSFRFLLNEKNNQNLDFDILCKSLHMDPYNTGSTIEWFPADYEIRNPSHRELAENAVRFIKQTLWQSDKLLSGIIPDVKQLRVLKDHVDLRENSFFVDKF